MHVGSRLIIGAFAAVSIATAADAADHIKIGALKSTNAAPIYIAIDKGFFAKEGLDPELVISDTAQTTAVAAAAGSIDFAATSTSAGLFSLAGSGELKIIGGLYSEAPGFHNFAVAASLKAYDGGLTTYKDLAGHSVAVTQVGSPVHYSLALIAEKYHLDLGTIHILPLQSIPNMASAIRGNQADATVINAISINPLLDAGQAKLIGWIGDQTPWQAAVIFTQTKMIAQHRATVEAFLRGFKAATRYYHDAFTGPDEKPRDGATAPEATAIIAKYTGITPAQVKASLAYVDRDGRIDIHDVIHQVQWFQSQKMLKDEIKADTVMDNSLVVPMAAR